MRESFPKATQSHSEKSTLTRFICKGTEDFADTLVDSIDRDMGLSSVRESRRSNAASLVVLEGALCDKRGTQGCQGSPCQYKKP
jgi:hypothetical protein